MDIAIISDTDIDISASKISHKVTLSHKVNISGNICCSREHYLIFKRSLNNALHFAITN